ncbi:MAG TPA: hypothetical protein VIY71_04030 [Solirubrobacterales bacterium]
MLGAVALAGLRPWATSSVVPNLSLAPGIGVGLGDATVVARAGSPEVGTGGIAAPTSMARVSASVAVPGTGAKQHASQPVLAVSPGRPLRAASAPVPDSPPPAPEPSPAVEPVVTTPAPAQAPAPPLVASVPSGPSGPPGTAGRPGTSVIGGGGPEQSCEGDEYVITVTFEEVEDEEVDYEEAEADILVERLEADGSATELHLRGDLTDVRDLVATLVSEGSCVQVDVVPPESDPVEEGSEAGIDAAESDEVAEPALP